MQKIKLNEKPLKTVEIEFNGQNIEVKPYFDFNEQFVLISTFLDNYFKESKFGSSTDLLSATYTNMLAVLDFMTNIDVEQIKIDNVVGSGLWDKIKESIKNYSDFESNLNDAIESKKQKSNDVMGAIQSAIEKFTAMDISDEKLSETKELVKNLSNQLNNTPVGKLISTGVVPTETRDENTKGKKNVATSAKSAETTKTWKTKKNT
jgi:hypothetical protein